MLPPQRRLEPWTTAAWEAPGQCIVEAIGGIDASTLAALQRAEAPTVWLLTDRLRAGDLATVRQRGATDIALASDAPSLLSCPALAQELSWLRADNIARPPQTRLRAAIGQTRPVGMARFRLVEPELGKRSGRIGYVVIRGGRPSRGRLGRIAQGDEVGAQHEGSRFCQVTSVHL